MSLARPIDRSIHPFVAPSEEAAIRAKLTGRAEPLTEPSDTETLIGWLGEETSRMERVIRERMGDNVLSLPVRPQARNRTHEDFRPAPRSERRPVPPAAAPAASNDDIPMFLRQPLPASEGPLPVADPEEPARPSHRRAPHERRSTLPGLFLAYLLFFLIPVTEWAAGFVDPRMAAVAPVIFFMGWLSIQALRHDQLFQLRMLTAWQVAHAAAALNEIRPWDGAITSMSWTATALAGAGALIVVAWSAVIETYEFRSSR